MAKIKTVVTGHGNFASGIVSALKLLSGEHADILAVDFTEEMNEVDLGIKLKGIVQDDIQTLFFTDLAGGTPFKEAVKISFNNDNIEVVSGCNLAALLESIFTEYSDVKSYAEGLVGTSKKTAELANFDDDDSTEDTEEDGI